VPLEIVEVIRRSDQGVTEPFICRGEDDFLYFVKGFSAGRLSQIREWICACLAQKLGLPIPKFAIVNVSDALIDPLSDMPLADLGSGLAFGSRKRELTADVLFSQIDLIPQNIRRDIMAFDRWIRNYDRTLSEQGGNPNILWASDTEDVVIIDHNNAFDVQMAGHIFASRHIFGREYLPILQDKSATDGYSHRFDDVLTHWPEIIGALPTEWLFMDADQSVPVKFNDENAEAMLREHRTEGFWSW